VAQGITTKPRRVPSLHERLEDNARALRSAYEASSAELLVGRAVVPAAEWLLDNDHLVEEQLREIRDDLPAGYYRQLPKLEGGPFAGYPRVLGVTWAFVAHTDSNFDPLLLRRFLTAYQRITPLAIGELWAVAITLRIVLVENLRRLADQITQARRGSFEADTLADRLIAGGMTRAKVAAALAGRSEGRLTEMFAAQLAKRLRNHDPRTMPALGWLEDRLEAQQLTVDEVVQRVQQKQGAANVTVRNVITSMRAISETDWAELIEDVSLVDARLRESSDFAAMDFATRNLYRTAIEELARGSVATEQEVATRALSLAQTARAEAWARGDEARADRVGDPGYFLIAQGRHSLEAALGFSPPLRLRLVRLEQALGVGGYVGVLTLTTAGLLALAYRFLGLPDDSSLRTGFVLLGLLPASEVAMALVNRVVTWTFGARPLPGLELKTGVPEALRTLVAVPSLLTNEADLLEQIEQLEVHHLADAPGELVFALLLDGLDARTETVPGEDELFAAGERAIAVLNLRHGPAPSGNRFFLLRRHRVYSESEQVWMGWERKRGKLHELNRVLRGARDTTFVLADDPALRPPAAVRFVVTLDADTQLPRDAASRLVGKLAHPLNRARFDERQSRVVEGYAILQPRVTPALPVGAEGSLYQRVFAGPSGLDPYAAAVSDVYQDLFGEGSYTGKGIYEIDTFEASLAGRIPEATLLSHDLFEGIFARAGLASDIEVVEEFPARYDVAGKRQHRWTRGDWQLLPWALGHLFGPKRLPWVGRVKMLDNLRSSSLAPATLAALFACWLLPAPFAARATGLLLVALTVPAFLSSLFSVLPRRSGLRLGVHFEALRAELVVACQQTIAGVAFLADRSFRMLDAIGRTFFRLLVSRRHLLEWTTAAQAKGSPRLALDGFARQFLPGVILGVAAVIGAMLLRAESAALALPFGLLWLLSPALALWASRAPKPPAAQLSTVAEQRRLRLIARATWRYFETFVTPADNLLPPDNFQEQPRSVIAHRTSPTNMGLYLLSAVVARDFGWAGTRETVERLEATLATMQKLRRFRGHFFNWYETRDLRVLPPAYVSSVDSGNLAGHLLALANACAEWIDGQPSEHRREGACDALALATEALGRLELASSPRGKHLAERLLRGTRRLRRGASLSTSAELVGRALRLAAKLAPEPREPAAEDLVSWLEAAHRALREHLRDETSDDGPALAERLLAIADDAREMALAMDFAFLLDPERKLLAIGYSLVESRLDANCYDLLASEARLASLFAIAKGDAPTRHWFRLGRSVTPTHGGRASRHDGPILLSWSGSMFEYLMPSLVMRAPAGSVLAETNRRIVARQEDYGRLEGVPWGVSESAYNARDIELTYQYANFGVPGLGLKRGLGDNLVVAPYATALAAMIDPRRAVRNFANLEALGAEGRYGFYDAVDFTRARLQNGDRSAVVKNYMAHHQGMTIVAIANTLQEGSMRARFHREPMIRACELLLQERTPRDVSNLTPRMGPRAVAFTGGLGDATIVRRLRTFVGDAPITHLLSNGRYAVMLTTTGAGYSRFRDSFVTRWREDPTRDDAGSFLFARDVESGAVWSPCAQPLGLSAGHEEVVFAEDHASFVRREGSLELRLDVLVSGEDDGEVRRLSLTNAGRTARELEVTSYAELVLTTAAADTAHPAFAKMFVVTEHLAETGALLATRRPRSPEEPRLFAAHFAVVEGEETSPRSFETSRAAFLGRGRTPSTARAMAGGAALGNTAGTVLDPIFALRARVRVPSGGVVRIAFWTVVATSREAVLDLVDKHLDKSAFDRAKTLAWTQAQVQLRHLDVSASEAAVFQRLAAALLYADPRFRATAALLRRGAGSQSALWQHGISGDRPIVVVRIDDAEDLGQVRSLLRAQEYWGLKRLAVDLVILNELGSSYLQDLQIAIESAVRSSQARPRFGDEHARGAVFTLRADLLTVAAREHLEAVARIVLVARKGTPAEQLGRLQLDPKTPAEVAAQTAFPPRARTRPPRPLKKPEQLELFNGLGGFDRDGTEYVVVLDADQQTPAPWINVIANPSFGFHVSAEGSGSTWSENSREHQLTPWSNDPVSDPPGEVLYVRDEVSGVVSSPTALPVRDAGRYTARHGRGYSRFEHVANGLAHDLTVFVPLGDAIKISRLRLENVSTERRQLSVLAYAEWVLGTNRGTTAAHLVSKRDATTGALFVENPWTLAYPGRVAFSDLRGLQTSWTADRREVVGRNGNLAAPRALTERTRLSGATGAGIDPCAALAATFELAPGESIEIVWLLGAAPSAEEARALLLRYRTNDLDAVFETVRAHWHTVLGAIQVKTPDRKMDLLLNGWLLYQTLACRVWARSAFYQASGAYGFRDQLQDGLALSFASPAETRRHLLRAAGRQFVEGDVQHWWLPPSGQGVRTRIADDRAWLAFALASYVVSSGDTTVLEERVPFLEAPLLRAGEHDSFTLPTTSERTATVYEHGALALDQACAELGALGLPLIGTGDWNDGMNRVGQEGRGESVWLAWFLIRTITLFAPLADDHARDSERAQRWRDVAEGVRAALERDAWDGAWYRRATFDDGTWLGSADAVGDACRIDSIAQSWAVLSGAAEPARAHRAMRALDEHLVRREDGLVLLFEPPFDGGPLDPGYIGGYPPGLRENGGQYSHAAMWAILAYAQLGLGERAHELFDLLNPLSHSATAEDVARYAVEPYAVAADIYSVAPHIGRGGWTWYTGAAGWMYRAGVEGILGLRRAGATVILAPCLPPAWPGFEATITLGESVLHIVVTRGSGAPSAQPDATSTVAIETRAEVDGVSVALVGSALHLALDGARHEVRLRLGT
jgi:cyclic beta-1,2-glucan synthetase